MVNLTRQEREVVLFLIFVALIGLGINFLTKVSSKIRIIGYITQDVSVINLNQARKEALIGLPGIGEILAQRILDYRQKKGKFSDITELKNIKGIGKSKYETLKDYFIIE